MLKQKFRRASVLAAGGILTAASLAIAGPALANGVFAGSNQPTVVTAPQGSTVQLDWTVKNTGATALFGSPATNGTITFNAPTGTTFPAQATVPTSYSSDGTTYGANAARLDNCTVGTGGTTLTCTWEAQTSGGAVYNWPAGGYFRFTPTVQVSPSAAPGTYSAAASATTPYNSQPGTNNEQLDINYGTLDVNIISTAGTPMIDPAVGGGTGAAALVLGAGVWAFRRRKNATANA